MKFLFEIYKKISLKGRLHGLNFSLSLLSNFYKNNPGLHVKNVRPICRAEISARLLMGV